MPSASPIHRTGIQNGLSSHARLRDDAQRTDVFDFKFKTVWRALLIFALVLGALAWPSKPARVGFSQVVSGIANVAAGSLEFEGGLRMQWHPSSIERVSTDNVDPDTQVWLQAPRNFDKAGFRLSLRRDAYLPLAIFIALIVALPLPWRQKATCLGIGLPIVLVAAVAAVWTFITYRISHSPASQAPDWLRGFVTFVFERGLTPPGNRVIAPLFLAGALVLLTTRRKRTPSDPRAQASESAGPDGVAAEASDLRGTCA